MRAVQVVRLLLPVLLGVAGVTGCGESDEPDTATRATVVTSRGNSHLIDLGSDEDLSGTSADVEMGRQVFMQTCATCHGMQAQGLPRQGLDLRSSEMLSTFDDHKLLEFLKTGRQPNAPDTKMGLLMPARGGNAAISDKDLERVVKFLRTIPQTATTKTPSGQSSAASVE